MIQNEAEKDFQAVVRMILASAIATYDFAWMKRYLEVAKKVNDFTDKMRLDLEFSDKVHEMREDGILTADASTILAKAEEIVKTNAPEMWYGLATKYGDSLILKPQK